MVEAQPDNRSRLPLADVPSKSRIALTRLAAIALIGSSAFLGPRTSSARTADLSVPTSPLTETHYKPSTLHEDTRRVIACFEADGADIVQAREKFIESIDGALQDKTFADADVTDLQADIRYDTGPLKHIPCLTAEVTDDGYDAIENVEGLVTVSEDVELQPSHHETRDLAGALLMHTGADFAHHHDIDGEGQRIVIADTGTNFQTSLDSYRSALDIYSGCVGVNYPAGDFYSVCPGGQDSVIADYAAAVYSDSLVNADHGHTEGQLANAVAHGARIVHVAMNTVHRGDGEQLVFFASEVVRAIDMGLTLNADSIGVSMATTDARDGNCTTFFESFNVAVRSAHAVDVPVFVSVGNNNEVDWPACVEEPGVYPITTVDYQGDIPYYAGYDDPRVLAALGEGVPVESLNGTLRVSGGTSYGPPVAAGLLALMQDADPTLSTDQALALFREHANDARASDGTRVPDMNIANILRQPGIGTRLGIYFRALLPYLFNGSH